MKILYVTSRFPYPLEKGDKLRAYNQIKNLSKTNEIFLFALTENRIKQEDIDRLKQYCKQVEVFYLSPVERFFNLIRTTFTGIPWQVGYFYSAEAQVKLDEFIVAYNPHHIFCQLIRTAEYAKKYKNIAKTLDYMDAFSKGINRRMASLSFFIKPLYKLEYKRLLIYEKELFSYFTNKIIISSQDRDLIPHPDKDKIAVVSNGVDADYFKSLNRDKEFDILYNGNMNYPPNIEGAKYLVNKVLPLVKKEKPGVKVLISGANPSRAIKLLASTNVIVSGWVPDIRENLGKSKMLVAPMFMSIGLQNKLLEAMAMQIPCITSGLAYNAIGAKNGESILVADTAEEYALQIISLLSDAERAEKIGKAGHDFIVNNYNWEMENNKLEKIINGF